MKRRESIQQSLFAVSPLAYFPFSEWITTTPVGTEILLVGQVIYVFSFVFAVCASLALLILVLFDKGRWLHLFRLVLTLVFIASCLCGLSLGSQIRTAGMKRFTQRSQTLIHAINKYEGERSSPPKSLNDLVPTYLPVIPSTGMMAYSEYKYYSGDEAAKQFGGNPWALTVFTPSGFLNFDQMVYLPNQNYPVDGYGGRLQRIGDWAYVHE